MLNRFLSLETTCDEGFVVSPAAAGDSFYSDLDCNTASWGEYAHSGDTRPGLFLPENRSGASSDNRVTLRANQGLNIVCPH